MIFFSFFFFFFSFFFFFLFYFFLFFYVLHPTPCCPEIWAIKIFQKFSPDSLEAHDNCQTTTSGVLSSQNHKQLQTTGGLFSKTFRANVPFVSFSFLFFIFYFLFFIFSSFCLFTSPDTMLSRNLSRKNIPKVFCGFSGGSWQLPNHYKWCDLLPKSQATSDHGWLIFKDVSGQCALRQSFFPFFLFFYFYFLKFFFRFSSLNTMLSRILSRKNIPKVFSGFCGGPWGIDIFFSTQLLKPCTVG